MGVSWNRSGSAKAVVIGAVVAVAAISGLPGQAIAAGAAGAGPAAPAAPAAAPGTIATIAGGVGGPGPARSVSIEPCGRPTFKVSCGLAFASGRLYFTDLTSGGLSRRSGALGAHQGRQPHDRGW